MLKDRLQDINGEQDVRSHGLMAHGTDDGGWPRVAERRTQEKSRNSIETLAFPLVLTRCHNGRRAEPIVIIIVVGRIDLLDAAPKSGQSVVRRQRRGNVIMVSASKSGRATGDVKCDLLKSMLQARQV